MDTDREAFAAKVNGLVRQADGLCPHCGWPMARKRVAASYGLTSKQAGLRDYLRGYIAEHDGVAPTFDEIVVALGLRSKNGVFRLLKALEERGLIARLPNRARAIVLVEAAG